MKNKKILKIAIVIIIILVVFFGIILILNNKKENSTNEIKRAFAYGVVDYLVKPFEFERFKEAINKYKARKKVLLNSFK